MTKYRATDLNRCVDLHTKNSHINMGLHGLLRDSFTFHGLCDDWFHKTKSMLEK
jgi:hypothetical protein